MRRPGRSWCDEADPLPALDAWQRMSELAQYVSRPKPPPSTAAELRARMDEQLFQDRLIYGTCWEKEYADGSKERIPPTDVIMLGKRGRERLWVPSRVSFEADPEPRLRPRTLALGSLPLDAWRKST
jgi:hypothetical protein